MLADTFGDFERAGEGDFDLEREGEGDFDFRGVLRVDVAPIRGKVRCHQICALLCAAIQYQQRMNDFQTGVPVR